MQDGDSAISTPIELSARVQSSVTVSRLAALVVAATLLDGHGFAEAARPLGVVAAGVLALRRAPFVGVLATAAVAAGSRLAGVR